MEKTERLYYLEPFLESATARVLACRPSARPGAVSGRVSSKVHNSPPEGGSLELILDRTIFYPEGGGQPCDLGFVSGLPLLAVEEGPEGLIHILPDATTERQALFHPGACVELKLDARRRRDHTQQHSGQHLVSAILERELGIHTLSFHLGESYSTIDITATSLDRSRIEAIETRVEEFVIANTPYRVHVCDSTRAREFPLRKLPPEGEEELRIIEIDGYDWVACCGTHVQKAGELRLVKILSAERYKGGTRLYFVAGDRAASLLFRQRDILARTALLLGCAAEEVEKRVEAHIETRKLQEQRMRALISRTAELEVDVAASSAGTTGLLGFDLEDRTAEEAMETIKAASRRGFAVLVLSRKDSTVCAQIPPSATRSSPSLASILKPLSAGLGGRGGGGLGGYRATFPSVEAAADFFRIAADTLGSFLRDATS